MSAKFKDYNHVAIVVDDKFVSVDNKGYWLDESVFAGVDPNLWAVQWNGSQFEIEWRHQGNTFVEDTNDYDSILQAWETRDDLEEGRKSDPLYGYQGEELKTKKKELDKQKVFDEFIAEYNKELTVDIPEGTFTFSCTFSKIQKMHLWVEAAKTLIEHTVDLYDVHDNRVTLSVNSAARVVALLTRENRNAVHNKLIKDKELETKVY